MELYVGFLLPHAVLLKRNPFWSIELRVKTPRLVAGKSCTVSWKKFHPIRRCQVCPTGTALSSLGLFPLNAASPYHQVVHLTSLYQMVVWGAGGTHLAAVFPGVHTLRSLSGLPLHPSLPQNHLQEPKSTSSLTVRGSTSTSMYSDRNQTPCLAGTWIYV